MDDNLGCFNLLGKLQSLYASGTGIIRNQPPPARFRRLLTKHTTKVTMPSFHANASVLLVEFIIQIDIAKRKIQRFPAIVSAEKPPGAAASIRLG
jgi:hypothetical protein